MEQAKMNTDREIWRESPDDAYSRIHVTQEGNIGINVGGHCYVMSASAWYQLAHDKFGKKLECGKCGRLETVSWGSVREHCQHCGERYVTQEQAYGTDCRNGSCDV